MKLVVHKDNIIVSVNEIVAEVDTDLIQVQGHKLTIINGEFSGKPGDNFNDSAAGIIQRVADKISDILG